MRLLIPYFSFSILALSLKLLFSSFTRSSVDLFGGMYGIVFEGKYFWFLYVMFEVLTILELFRMLKLNMVYIWMIAIILYLLGLYLNTKFLCLNQLGYYLIFTLIGMYYYKCKTYLDILLQRWNIVLLLLAMFIGLYVLRESQISILKEIGRFALALCGTGMTYSLCLTTKKAQNRLTSLFSYLGILSLPIYLVHMINQLPIYYLTAKMNLPQPIMSVVVIFLTTTIVTYFMVEMLIKIPICRYMLGMSPCKEVKIDYEHRTKNKLSAE